MTRWVRCGSSQKHKKMPGNATKWGEFDNQHAREIPPKNKKNIDSEIDFNKNVKSLPSTSFFNKAEVSLNEDFFEQGKYLLTENSTLDENHLNISPSQNEEDDNNFLTIKMHNSKIKKKRNKFDIKYPSLDGNTDEIYSNKVTIKHKKIKLKNDCSIVTQNNKMFEQADDHNDFVENSKIAEESFSHGHGKKKRKNKKQKRYNKVDSESFSINEGNTDEIDSNEVTIKHKMIKLEKNYSIVTQNNKMLEQADSKNTEESFSQEHDTKKRKKNKKEKRYNKVDSESFSINDGTVKTFFENSSESHSIKQDVKCITASDKIVESVQSFHDINRSSKKQRVKKYSQMNNDSNQSSVNNESAENPSSKVSKNWKEIHLNKLKKKRQELGLIQLPQNVETKLYKIRKRLKEKGFPPEKLKEMMRQERRREELKFRKVFNRQKLCFGCREPGHVLADCPKKSGSLKQETGICFKCGSVEHTSYKCPEKIQGYPYASCFICKEQGHISRDCPQNKHGVYPKGGRCNLCGNVNHLKKDCPTLKKLVEIKEEEITLPTLNEGDSIDSEVVKKEEIKRKFHKKSKIVKF